MRRWLPSALLASALTLLVPTADAATECRHDPAEGRPKIGLALGGGGARGYAHIGVLKRLHELRIPIDYIAGTSIGSITGGMLAAGLSGEEIETVARGIDWVDMLDDRTPRQDRTFRRKLDDDLALFGPRLGVGPDAKVLPAGAISGQKVLFLLESVMGDQTQVRHFDELPIPFRAVAADLADGSEVVIDQGSPAVAMRASMAVPAVFDPVPFYGKLLVDGGIANNLPISVVRDMGADIVIAVDVGSGLYSSEEIKTAVDVAAQLTNILVENTSAHQRSLLTDRDLLLSPSLGEVVGASDFDKLDEGAAIGYAAALVAEKDLARLTLSPEDYERHRAYVTSCVSGPPTIQWVELDNQSRFRDSILRHRLDIAIGEPLDVGALERSLQSIYALGFLQIARYEVREREGEMGVVVQVRGDERGGNLVEYGLDIFGERGTTNFNFRLGFLKTDLDDSGAEFRALAQVGSDEGLLVEYYKPFGDSLKYIIEPQFVYQRELFSEYDGKGNQLSQFDVKQSTLQLGLIREFGTKAAVAVGARAFTGTADQFVGDPDIPDIDFDGGEWTISARYDRLDNAYFPQDGTAVGLEYIHSSDTLGADDDYKQIIFEGYKSWQFGSHNLILGGIYNTTLDDNAPVYALFRAGGFLRLSGFDDGEIAGQHFGMVTTAYRYSLNAGGLLPGYLGGSIEYGNVAEDRADIFDEGLLHGSLYLGFDTPIGALYTGVGVGENGREKFFFRIGNVFRRSSLGR